MKPESRLIKSIHDKLHPDIYREKFHNTYRGGTPDCYYMGFRDDLWVEWKWLPKFPKTITPALSPLQLAWLTRAADRGRDPKVIVGSPDGCVVLSWPYIPVARAEAQVLSREQVVNWIQERCGLEASESPR